MSIDKITLNASIAENVLIGHNVKIGNNVIIKSGCIIGDNVVLEDGVFIDYNVLIRNNVTVKKAGTVGARCILGEYLADFYADRTDKNHSLIIGEKAVIRSDTIIYGNNTIGDNFQTGHRAAIRENAVIGNNVRIGTNSDVQGNCVIQDYVNIHSNVFIAPNSTIKKYAWIFPGVILTNDPHPPSETVQGVTIEEFAAISAGAVVLPGVIVGQGAVVGAGAVVTKDIERNQVAVGNPARAICGTDKVRDDVTGEKVYPWQYNFDRGMPWKDIGYEKWSLT